MEKEIIDLISSVLEIPSEKLTLETNLVRDLEIDSLDLVDLIVAFEEKYQKEIPDQDIKNMQTISDIVNYLNKANNNE